MPSEKAKEKTAKQNSESGDATSSTPPRPVQKPFRAKKVENPPPADSEGSTTSPVKEPLKKVCKSPRKSRDADSDASSPSPSTKKQRKSVSDDSSGSNSSPSWKTHLKNCKP